MRTWLSLLGAALLVACGAARDERLPSERLLNGCTTDADCGSNALCQSGSCVSTDGPTVVGKVQGAPVGFDVAALAAGQNVCATHPGQGLVCTLAMGGSVSLVAPKVPGYRFVGWTGDSCKSEHAQLDLVHVQHGLTCTAQFAKQLVVSGTVDGEPNLAVVASSASPNATCAGNACDVDPRSTVVLTAPPRDGMKLTGFDGAGCENLSGYHVTVSAVDHDVTCVAKYSASLTARGRAQGLAAGASATITASSTAPGAQCEGPLCSVDSGADVTLLAAPLDHYRISGWTGEERCLGNDPALVLHALASSVVCSAVYVPRHDVRVVSEGAVPPANALQARSTSASAVCSGPLCTLDEGQDATLLAGTVPGYRLASWSGDGCTAAGGVAATANDVTRDVTCTAHYAPGVAVTGTVLNADAEVSAQSSSAGASCAHGSCTIDAGGTVTLTAPSLPGRTFLGWSGDAGCAGTSATITLGAVTTSTNCFATFALRYDVSAAAQPVNGGVPSASSAALNAACSAARCEVDANSSVTLQANANPGFRFTGWNGDGACTGSAEALTLSSVSSDVACNANFVARVRVASAIDPPGTGSVAASTPQTVASAACAAGACTVDVGGDVQLTAQAAAGFMFSGWTGCGDPSSAQTLVVHGAVSDQTCTAHFETLKFIVAAVAGVGGSTSAQTAGATCSHASCSVVAGASVALHAQPDAAYTFAGWTGCSGSGPDLTIANVQQSQTCTASFARVRVTVGGESVPAGVGAISASSAAANAACTGPTCQLDYGSAAQLSAEPAPAGYRFDSWTGCTGGLLSGSALTFASVTSDVTCQAHYIKRWTVTGVSSDPTLGSTNCVTGCSVDQGGSIDLVAAPSSQNVFLAWMCSSGVQSSALRLAITGVGTDVRCVAMFAPSAQ